MAAADGGASARKEIIQTALILSGLTAFEFLIAFIWKDVGAAIGVEEEFAKLMKNLLFIILTLFKAFYIVAYFMHLKHEIRRLSVTIVLPFLFIIWLIIGLMLEGGYWGAGVDAEQTTLNKVEMVEDNA
ncbi:MAG: cytochrome C oxidase subunit IV family protein [Bacteroidia bacterium]|nr:cytochrome C oxidase subunit IV family protein [Bacteroidia bacterium]